MQLFISERSEAKHLQ